MPSKGKGKEKAAKHRVLDPYEKPIRDLTMEELNEALKENPKHKSLQWEHHKRILASCDKALNDLQVVRERRKMMQLHLKFLQEELKANKKAADRALKTQKKLQRSIYWEHSPKARFLMMDVKYAIAEPYRANRDPALSEGEQRDKELLQLWADASDTETFWEHMKDILPPDFEENLPENKRRRRKEEAERRWNEEWQRPSIRSWRAEADRRRIEHNFINMPDF